VTVFSLVFLSICGVAWLTIRRLAGTGALAAYVLTVSSLGLIMLVARQQALGLFYLFCSLGFLPILLRGSRRSAKQDERELAAAGLRVKRMSRILVPCLFLILAVGFFIIVRGIGPSSLSAPPMSLLALLVRRGHSLEMVGATLVLFSLVCGIATGKELRK